MYIVNYDCFDFDSGLLVASYLYLSCWYFMACMKAGGGSNMIITWSPPNKNPPSWIVGRSLALLSRIVHRLILLADEAEAGSRHERQAVCIYIDSHDIPATHAVHINILTTLTIAS